MKLSKEEKDLISKEIEKLESKSSAEIVAVITQKSDNYKYISLLIALFFVALMSFLLILFSSFSAVDLLKIQILIFMGIFIFFENFNSFIFKLLSKKYKYKKASQNAQRQFFNLGLHKTKTKQALMFFVSFDEKYVQIVTDEEISKKIKDDYWQNIVDEFICDIKKEELVKAYLKAIKACNSILIEKFPIKDDDEDELSNEVIELKQ